MLCTIRLIKLLISAFYLAGDHFLKGIYSIFGKKLPGSCVVLYYHVVTKDQRSSFARQMDDIIKYARPVSTSSKSHLETGAHHVAVTFDDAFVCIIENALPELLQRNIPSTIFVPTGYLGRYSGWIKNEARQNAQQTVMSENQLRELKAIDMVSIGSHCVTHANLLLLNEQDAKNEIIKSKHDLENILQEGVKTLSFPHGAFNHTHVEFAREVGYKRVFSILPKCAFSGSDEYVTGRVRVDTTDWRLEFRLKLFGAYRWLPVAFALKHKMRSLLRNCLSHNLSEY